MSEKNGLPEGWTTAALAGLIGDGIFKDGDWVETKDQDPEGEVRLTQLADVGDGFYRDRSARFMTREKATELRCTFLEPGDLLIARMPDPLGRACIFPGDNRPCVTAVDVCILRAGHQGVDQRWLMHIINSSDIRSAIFALRSGSTRLRVSRSKLASIEVPVPPLKEQRRIVAAIEEQFSRLDAGVASLERARANLRRYRTAVLKAAVEGRLTEAWREENPDTEPASELLERILRSVADGGKRTSSQRSKRRARSRRRTGRQSTRNPPHRSRTTCRSCRRDGAGPTWGNCPGLLATEPRRNVATRFRGRRFYVYLTWPGARSTSLTSSSVASLKSLKTQIPSLRATC